MWRTTRPPIDMPTSHKSRTSTFGEGRNSTTGHWFPDLAIPGHVQIPIKEFDDMRAQGWQRSWTFWGCRRARNQRRDILNSTPTTLPLMIDTLGEPEGGTHPPMIVTWGGNNQRHTWGLRGTDQVLHRVLETPDPLPSQKRDSKLP